MAIREGEPAAHAGDTRGSGRNRVVLVVGAGRSGTSALTRGLAALGVELGDHLKPATAKNPTGFFEDEDLLRIGKRARSCLGLRAESIALIEDEAWEHPDLEKLCREAVEIIEERFGNAAVWCFKYAQTLRLLPFWLRVLERARVDASWVVASRNPVSVARSRSKLDRLRGVQEKSDAEWLVSVVPYFRRLAGQPAVVVDFDLLMEDPSGQLERVADALDLRLDETARAGMKAFSETFLVGGMRHTVFGDSDLDKAGVHPLTRDAYRWLRKLAEDEIDPDDPGLREDWARIERELAAQAPLFRYVDRVVAELRLAEQRGVRGLGVRLQQRLKRVRWIAAAFGVLKLRGALKPERALEPERALKPEGALEPEKDAGGSAGARGPAPPP